MMKNPLNLKLNDPAVAGTNEFLTQLAETAYLMVSKCGFRGSFLSFLCSFKEELEQVLVAKRKG